MPFCGKCGAAVDAGAAFCSKCGAPQSEAAIGSLGSAGAAAGAQQTGMAENVAGALCYLLGWITGIIFLLIDKRPFVRFHATQSIVVFGGLQIIGLILGGFWGVGIVGLPGFRTMGFGWGLYWLLDLIVFVLWIVLMIKAHQGERFRVPIAADLAEQIFGKA